MYLRRINYQMSYRMKSFLPCFHKAHLENLILLTIGIAYSRSVALPQAASAAPLQGIQLDSRVARFERLIQCEKFIPLEVLRPFACQILEELSRKGGNRLLLIMDRTMINDTLNLLYVSVAYHGRALPLGWVEVPHEGTSSLALQQELLTWVKGCCPAPAAVTIVADREFHSIHLASWLDWELGARVHPENPRRDLCGARSSVVQSRSISRKRMASTIRWVARDERPKSEGSFYSDELLG
jgi:hypothetical protein